MIYKHLAKKKSIKILLKKLNDKKEVLEKALKEQDEKKDKKELEEEKEIIICHIEKGEKILKKLNSHNETKEKNGK